MGAVGGAERRVAAATAAEGTTFAGRLGAGWVGASVGDDGAGRADGGAAVATAAAAVAAAAGAFARVGAGAAGAGGAPGAGGGTATGRDPSTGTGAGARPFVGGVMALRRSAERTIVDLVGAGAFGSAGRRCSGASSSS